MAQEALRIQKIDTARCYRSRECADVLPDLRIWRIVGSKGRLLTGIPTAYRRNRRPQSRQKVTRCPRTSGYLTSTAARRRAARQIFHIMMGAPSPSQLLLTPRSRRMARLMDGPAMIITRRRHRQHHRGQLSRRV